MTFQQFNDQIYQLLLKQCGMPNVVFEHLTRGKPEPVKSLFFAPSQSKSDLLYKALTVITAPVCFSIITLELGVNALYLGAKALIKLAQRNTESAKINSIDAALHLTVSFISLIMALSSSIINLVDLIGSTIATVKSKNEAITNEPACNYGV